jgi:xylulokinase
MSREYLLGIDIGTSGSSGVLIDKDINIINTTSVDHDISTPNPGWVEHDAEEIWWSDFKRICAELIIKENIDPCTISGIGISALHTAFVPVDGSGDPLRPGILYGVDTRSTDEIAAITQQVGEEYIYKTCKNRLTYQSVGPKLLWYKENEPRRFNKTEKVLDATGYIVYKLTDKYTIDNANASFFHPLFDPVACEWADEMFHQVGVPRNIVPNAKWSTELAGKVTSKAAKETGLEGGTPVIVGTGDSIASLVGVSATNHGDSIFMYGTTGVIYTTLKENMDSSNLWSFPHCLEDKYIVGGGMATAGAIVRWFADEFGHKEQKIGNINDIYAKLDQEATDISAGSDGLVVLPYFNGERTPFNDESARGAIFGLSLSHTKAHIYRAILESVGYGFRHHLEEMRDNDIPVDTVRAIGGGASSTLWRQIVSDITGVSQEYVESPIGSPLGDAYLAGLGTNVFSDLSLIRNNTEVVTRTDPNQDLAETYDDYYTIYRELYPQTKEQMHAISSSVK